MWQWRLRSFSSKFLSSWLIYKQLVKRCVIFTAFGKTALKITLHYWVHYYIIGPNLLVWKFCGNAQFPIVRISGTLRISWVCTKFLHQDIRWNYGTLRSATGVENMRSKREGQGSSHSTLRVYWWKTTVFSFGTVNVGFIYVRVLVQERFTDLKRRLYSSRKGFGEDNQKWIIFKNRSVQFEVDKGWYFYVSQTIESVPY